MALNFKSILKNIMPLDEEGKRGLNLVKEYVDETRAELVKGLLKDKKISVVEEEMAGRFFKGIKYPQIKANAKNVDASAVNKDIKDKAIEKSLKKFSERAFEILPGLIAPNIVGMEDIKKAAALQLFAKQPFHMLLIGDPGTGKTEILRSIFNLAPISSFGLGSGTSGAGLAVTVKGDKIMKGILPLADNGICCIDELNLMKEESRAGLYNAMEKGFVSYDKGGNHYQFDARARVIATANPKEDKFAGKTAAQLKEEIPFDSALLTRFNVVFLIRKPDEKDFNKITSAIVADEHNELSNEEIMFIKNYIELSFKFDVEDISKPLQEKITLFISELKKNEHKFVVEVSPRLTIGFMRMCKALARLEGRKAVEEKDIERVKIMFEKCLNI